MGRILLVLILAGCIAWGVWGRGCEPGAAPATQSGSVTAGLDVRTIGDAAMFQLKITDDSGKTFRYLRLPNGRRAPAPQVTITNSKGQPIHRFRMGYG
jgi:hypothetical protein